MISNRKKAKRMSSEILHRDPGPFDCSTLPYRRRKWKGRRFYVAEVRNNTFYVAELANMKSRPLIVTIDPDCQSQYGLSSCTCRSAFVNDCIHSDLCLSIVKKKKQTE